jgi:endonuclease YncB( thermonuclease family)
MRRQSVRGSRARPFNGNAALFIVIVAAALAVYGYEHWHGESLAPIAGTAWVVDGDTIDFRGRRIRLEGIDAPEAEQTCADAVGHDWPCGREATRALTAYIRSRDVTCEPTRFDRYERTLATCRLADGTDIGAWMVQQGLALDYGRARRYRAEQAEAEAARRGIWSGRFTPPQQWRQQHPR